MNDESNKLYKKSLEMHQGGKIEVSCKHDIKTKKDLSLVYTPWVGKICELIAREPEKVHELTIKKNTVAVLSDGTAVLGLGDLGPYAAIPVMEGKAMLFKALAGVDAFPICVNTKSVDEIIHIARMIEPVFGGFNLEDISAPRCFEIEKKLQEQVNIPVFHDDQHGTAVVSLAALYNSLKLVNKSISEVKIIVLGAGAAAIATSKIFISAGAKNLILCDRAGAIYEGRTDNMNFYKDEIAGQSNSNNEKGTLSYIMEGADVFVGLSGPNLLSIDDVKKMNDRAIVFAMSNPVPEVDPHECIKHVEILATGRSDFPNQINNVLCFPGLFRGLLDGGAKKVTEKMKLVAAQAIAELVSTQELNKNFVIPDALDPRVAPAVARAVMKEI